MPHSIDSQFSRGFAWMAAGGLVEQGTNALVFLALSRLLDPASFGLWAMAAAVLLLCEALVRETLSDYLITADDASPALRDTVFWTILALGAVLAAALALIAEPAGRFYHQGEVARLLLAVAPVPVLIASAAVPAALLRRAMQFRAMALRAILGMVAGAVVGLVLALHGYGVWALVAQRLTLAGVNAVIAWLAMGWRPGLRFDAALLGPLLRFGRGIVGIRVAELSVVQLPSVLIGALQGPRMLGYFTIAWRIAELSSLVVSTPLRMASQSAFAAMIRRSAHEAAGLLVDLTSLTAFIAFPVFAVLCAAGRPTLTVLAGTGWGPSAPVLSVLAVYGAYLCIAKLWQSFLIARGRPGDLARVQWAEVAGAGVLIALFGRTSPASAAAALLAAIFVFAPLRLRAVAQAGDTGAALLIRPLLLPALGAVCTGLVIAGADRFIAIERPVLRLLVELAIGMPIYAAWSAAFLRDRAALLAARFSAAPRSATIG